MTDSTTPEVISIKRHAGIAGQVAYTATVRYGEEDDPGTVTFIGSTYGGPVVMRTDTAELFVSFPERFGSFGEAWVRRFFTD